MDHFRNYANSALTIGQRTIVSRMSSPLDLLILSFVHHNTSISNSERYLEIKKYNDYGKVIHTNLSYRIWWKLNFKLAFTVKIMLLQQLAYGDSMTSVVKKFFTYRSQYLFFSGSV